MLAEQNETFVKFLGLFSPVIGNVYIRGEPDSFFSEGELATRGMMNNFTKALAKDYETCKDDVDVFSNLMSDEVNKKMPRTLIMTYEFDTCRKGAEEGAVLYRRNGRLIDFGCIKGTHHCSYFKYDLQRTDEFFRVVQQAVTATL